MRSRARMSSAAMPPAVILIPGREGSLGIGTAGVHAAAEKAVGADIL